MMVNLLKNYARMHWQGRMMQRIHKWVVVLKQVMVEWVEVWVEVWVVECNLSQVLGLRQETQIKIQI